MSAWTLLKLGGSLLDLADLRDRLKGLLTALRQSGRTRLAVLVGGGPTTDAIRWLDSLYDLGQATSHNLALRALTVNAHAIRALLGEGRILTDARDPVGDELTFLDPWALLDQLEREAGRPILPHTWEATSDSVALVLAGHLGAGDLLLLKSVGPAGPLAPGERHPADVVDACFLPLWQSFPNLRVEVVPLREKT